MLGMERRSCQYVFVLESERNFVISGMVFGEFQDNFPGYFRFISRIFPIPDGIDDEEGLARPSCPADSKTDDFDPY